MTIDYHKVWDTMNELEMVTSKICSAREILDSAINRLQEHQYDKAETLLFAVDEYLQYYIQEFDTKFKDAWKETVHKVNTEMYNVPTKNADAWNSFFEEETPKSTIDKVVKWILPVEADGPSGEYFITFPDDLLEAANLQEGDEIEWVDQHNGTFILRKPNVVKTNS